MSDFIFMPPEDPYSTQPNDELLERTAARRETARLAMGLLEKSPAPDDRYRDWKSTQTNRIIALRIPIELLARLNQVAADAATNRSHLIRQMVADYLNSMESKGIRFSGCLLSVDTI